MIRVQLACDAAKPGDLCPTFESQAVRLDEADGWISVTLDEHGWVRHGDKHYCPRHNPDLIGERINVGFEYVEIAPGVRARCPGAGLPGDWMTIEVQVDKPADPPTVDPIREARERFEERAEFAARAAWGLAPMPVPPEAIFDTADKVVAAMLDDGPVV